MNQNLSIFSIKNSRWIAGWMQHFCNSMMMKAAKMRKTKVTNDSWLFKVLPARFVVEIVDQLDITDLEGAFAGA